MIDKVLLPFVRGRETPKVRPSAYWITYVFEVLADATKAEIKAAVELLFKEQKVEVAAVNVVNLKGKQKRHGRFEGRRRDVKKAYVSLKGEGDINFVEGVA